MPFRAQRIAKRVKNPSVCAETHRLTRRNAGWDGRAALLISPPYPNRRQSSKLVLLSGRGVKVRFRRAMEPFAKRLAMVGFGGIASHLQSPHARARESLDHVPGPTLAGIAQPNPSPRSRRPGSPASARAWVPSPGGKPGRGRELPPPGGVGPKCRAGGPRQREIRLFSTGSMT